MYFQVCSNSAYPQHSGEQYRTNNSLVIPPVYEVYRGYIVFVFSVTMFVGGCVGVCV